MRYSTKTFASKRVKLPAQRVELPGKVGMITGSAFLPAYKAWPPADLPVKRENLRFAQGEKNPALSGSSR
jgi:hypothetical protein